MFFKELVKSSSVEFMFGEFWVFLIIPLMFVYRAYWDIIFLYSLNNFLLPLTVIIQTWQFKTTEVYFIVSLGQKSRHDWTGFSDRDLKRMISRCYPSCIPFSILFSSSGNWQNLPLYDYRREASILLQAISMGPFSVAHTSSSWCFPHSHVISHTLNFWHLFHWPLVPS